MEDNDETFTGDEAAEAAPTEQPGQTNIPGVPMPGLHLVGILYHGPASQQAIDMMASILGSQVRGMGHVVIGPTETLYVGYVPDQGDTYNALMGKLAASKEAAFFSPSETKLTDEQINAATRTTGVFPTLTA